MKICDVISAIERYAPLSLALDFDNVGLLVGDKNRGVDRVLLTLDVDEDVVREAQKTGAGLIISHHPIMFDPVKKITSETAEGRTILALIKNDIALYSAHTNLDAAPGGINDLMAVLLGIDDSVPITPDENGEGIGRVGYLKKPMTLKQLATKVKKVFSAKAVQFSGSADELVTKVAFCSGGGNSMAYDALNIGAQVYISGDIKYNIVRDVVAEGMNVIELSHFDSEIIVTQLFEKILMSEFGNAIELVITASNRNVYSNIV